VTRDSIAALDRHTELLEHRRRAGHVRQCHGDLHLRNIVLIDERPVLFDAIEFNDRISCIDVLYDLAFLVMDLIRAGHAEHASTALNRYLEQQDELDGLAAMPLFLSCRAAVRAKVHAIEARLAGADRASEDRRLAVEYLRDANAFLKPRAAAVVAIGGFSGSGKSSVAAGLAPGLGLAPGAVVLRSDVIRKRRRGVGPETRLGADAYTPEQNRLVYDALIAQARIALRAGYTVIADAVFGNEVDRAAIDMLAREARVPFTGLWLAAPVEVLKARVGGRAGDASDAGPEVIDRQLAGSTGTVSWTSIDASGDEGSVLARVRSAI
jgi:predicted kinase